MATSSRSFSIVSKRAFALSSGPAQLTTSSSAGDWPTYSRQAPTLYIRLQGSLGEIAFIHYFRYLKQRQAPLFSSIYIQAPLEEISSEGEIGQKKRGRSHNGSKMLDKAHPALQRDPANLIADGMLGESLRLCHSVILNQYFLLFWSKEKTNQSVSILSSHLCNNTVVEIEIGKVVGNCLILY